MIPYAAAKAALANYSKALSNELAPKGIRVNAVCPGYVATGWFKNRFGEERFDQITARIAATTPLRRAATAEDIAQTVLFLAGSESANITGEFILTDAGMHLDPSGGAARR